MVCMETLVKENTLVNLQSAMPARWVDGREMKEMLCSTSPCKLWSTAATLFSFINSKQENMDLQAKENIKGISQYLQ
jgi:predicted transcriptional regulator